MTEPSRTAARPRARAGVIALVITCLALPLPAARALDKDDPAFVRARDEQGRRFVEAFNADDPAARSQALRAVYAPESLADGGEAKLAARLDALRGDFGGLDFHHAEASVGGQGANLRLALHVFAKSAKTGGWHDFQFMLDPAPPHGIRQLLFIANVSEPVYLPNGEITSPDTQAWLDGYVEKLARGDDLAGTLLIAQGDRVLFRRAFGFADAARTRPMKDDTRISLASGGKMFTALAIASLVEEGRLRYDDPLAKVLPAVADRDFAARTTIAHLLSHTSGVGEYWNDNYRKHAHELDRVADFLPFVLDAGVLFEPGSRFRYSNSNYILLGMVLEAVTGKTYDDVLAERVFRPAGMTETGLFRFDASDPAQAERLARDGKGWKAEPSGGRGSSAGGAMSTTADMLRFARALVAGRIVSKETLAVMVASKTAGIPDAQMAYGYGFEPQDAPGAPSFGHGGITTGVNFEFRYFPRQDITLIAFSNQDNGAYDDLRKNATRLITGER